MRAIINKPTLREMRVPIQWIGTGGKPGVRIADGLAIIVGFYRQVMSGADPVETDYARHYADLATASSARVDWAREARRWADLCLDKGATAGEKSLPVKLNAAGVFELLDGHHRAAQCISNGQDAIDVAVKEISPAWKDLCDRLHRVLDRPYLYQPIEHPWFDDWGCERGNLQRYQVILDAVQEFRGDQRLASNIHLDIGSNSGRLCREFNRTGWGSLGLDANAEILGVADYLNMVFGTDCSYFFSGLHEFLDRRGGIRHAVITCLSVCHHWLRAGMLDKYEEAVRLVADCSNLFLIDHAADHDAQSRNDRVPLEAERFMTYLIDRIGCRFVRKLGVFEYRPLFIASKVLDG